MTDSHAFPTPRPTINAHDPWQWLAAGWRDMRQAPVASLLYGVIAAIISVLLISALIGFDMGYLVLPLTASFMLVGPFLAVGLYDISWRLETGEPHGLLPAVRRRGAGPTQLALVGLLLMLMLLAWWRLAMLIYALFFGLAPFPGLAESVNLLFFTADGLTMLAVGTAVGGVIACAVFAAAAFSIPILLARDVDAISAIIASVGAVRAAPFTMLVWAWLIVVLTVCGLITACLGLIVTFPLVGHATWHAYRHVIEGVAPGTSGGAHPVTSSSWCSPTRVAVTSAKFSTMTGWRLMDSCHRTPTRPSAMCCTASPKTFPRWYTPTRPSRSRTRSRSCANTGCRRFRLCGRNLRSWPPKLSDPSLSETCLTLSFPAQPSCPTRLTPTCLRRFPSWVLESRCSRRPLRCNRATE